MEEGPPTPISIASPSKHKSKSSHTHRSILLSPNGPSSSHFASPVFFVAGFTDTRGRRSQMEDVAFSGHFSKKDIFCVLDGHSGCDAARSARGYLIESLAKSDSLEDAFTYADQKLNERQETSGTTVTVLCLEETKGSVAYVGDSTFGYFIPEERRFVRFTKDHRTTNEKEAEAVKARGGLLICSGGSHRVGGSLLVTRSLGDYRFKGMISSTPDILDIPPEVFRPGTIMLLATDGLWDSLSDDDIMEILERETDVLNASKELRSLAVKKGSMDNISLFVIRKSSPEDSAPPKETVPAEGTE